MKAFHCRPLVLLLLICFQTCGSDVGGSLVADTGLQKTSRVLNSTDMRDLSDLQLDKMDADRLPGQYSSEQGGSVLFLIVTPQGKDTWIVERIYTEPATQNVSRQYTVHKTEYGLASKKGSLVLRQTKEGLIALEKDSGLDSIPASYWIHYLKQE